MYMQSVKSILIKLFIFCKQKKHQQLDNFSSKGILHIALIHTLNLLKMRQLEGKLTKSGGKQHEGYPFQSRTLKLSGRCWRTSEYTVSLIISILRLFISLKALSLNLSTLPCGKLSNIMTSILSFSFPSKNMLTEKRICLKTRK